MRGSASQLSPASDDDTLTEGASLLQHRTISIDDWSQTGRGSHVEFNDGENVLLKPGRFLGRGAMGDVHEVTIQGYRLALKRMVIKRKLGGNEKKEIEILKRLSSHEHIIQLVGTYTHRQFLGLLLYPVAVCDLHTFFEDVEAWHATGNESTSLHTRKEVLDTAQKTRLDTLGYDFPLDTRSYYASPVYYSLGCLISALSYLHDEKIRHKDLKPSNILLSKDRMWLSDFGSATDFSLLSQSATDNARGTPRYFSPEMAAWKRSGRASDIFSLGCVLLEIVILHEQGTLRHVRLNRSADPAFHANLDRVNAWFSGPLAKPPSTRRAHLVSEITSMLARNHEVRPVAKELLIRVTGYDLAQTVPSKYSLFGDCCRGHFMSPRQMKRHTDTITRMDSDLQRAHDELAEKKKQMIRVTEEHAISAPWLHEGQAGSGTGSTGKHTDTLERDTSTLRSECIECISRWLEKDQASPEELIKMLSSKTQRNAINTTDAKMSTPEWQLEKKKLEQRIAERTEAPGGYFESLQYSLLHPTRTSHRESAAPPPTQGLQGISSPLPAVLVMSQDNPKPRKMLAHHRELEEPPLDSESEYDMERRRRRRARKEARSREIMGLE